MRRKISKHFSGNTERLVNKVFFVVIPVLLGLSLVFGVYNSSRANQTAEQLRKQNEQLVALSESQENALKTTRGDVADLKETLLCIGVFFSSTDRAKLRIKSYVPCVVENMDTGESRELTLTGEGSPNTPSTNGGSPKTDPRQDTSVPSSSSNHTPPQQPEQSDSSQIPPIVPDPPRSVFQRIVNGTIDIVEGLF